MMKTLQRCGVLVLTLALLIGILPVDTILYAKAQPTKKETDVSNKKTSGQMTTLKYPMHQLQKMTQRNGQVMRKTSALDKQGNLIYPVENGNIYFNKTKNTIVKADQTITSAIIPSNIEGIPVKAIGNEAFRDCFKLKTISLPKDLEEIGYRAFSHCTSLEKIFIPKTVVRTGKYYGQPGAWFWGCEKLKEIILEEGTSRIIEGSFSGIPNSFKMVIPASVKEIGSQAFANSKGIKKVTYGEPTTVGTIVIPQTVKSIGESAFYDCSELENVKWPSHIKNIPNEAFRDCFKLKTISLPKDLEEIGYRAFSHCTSLEKIFIPKTVVRTGKYYGQPGAWFWGCEKLKEIILEEGTSRIIEGSFSGISSSYKMVIPESVKEIGERAFANSENLKTLTLNKNITLIADNSFENCSSLELEFPLNYVCLEHVFKKNIPYKLIIGEHKMNAGILNEKSSRFKVDGITPEGYYNCSIQYEVDSNKFAALKNKMIRMRLDNNTRMVYSSIKMNGQKLTNISMIDHLLSIPVTENHGTISFLLKPFNGIQAKAFASFSYSDSDKKMDDLIGYISSSEAGITCETPSFTSEKTFEIQGYSKADAVVKIFIDEKLQGEVKTDHKGFYKYSLHHNFNTFGSHTIKVNLNETNKWVLKKVVFDPNHPELEKFEMIYSNHHLEAGNDYHSVDLLKNDISYVTAWYNRPLTFKIKYKNDKNIGAVFLNGYIEGKKVMIQMFKDKKTGEWVNKYPFVPSDPLKLPSSIWPTVIRKDQLKTENDDKIDLDLKKNEKLDKSVARMSKNYFSETLKIKKDDIKPGFSRKIDKNKTSSSLLALAQTYDKLISSSEVEYDSILAEYKHSLASYIKSSVSKFKKMNGITIEKNPNIEVVSNIAMNMLSIGLGELNADLGFVFDTITNTIDVYTCYYYMFRVLAAIENNNKADLKKYGNLLIRKSLVASFNIYSLFNPTQGLANAITMGLFSFALEKILDGIDFATGIEFLVNLPKIIRDLSGYVYEAVTSNQIEGAVVSIYHQDLVNGTPVFWESAKFGQENNQITKADGKYGWNVPEGNWQVRCQKPGYENYTSGWIKVPPQHDDINIGLISKETPTLSNGIRKDDGIELNFSKYMKPDSVKNMVVNDEKGEVLEYDLDYSKEEKNEKGEVLAKKYILKIKNKGKVAYSLKTNGKIKSYAGISMDEKTMILK